MRVRPASGVEHLLRDVKDASVSTLAAEVGTLAAGLGGLKSRLLQVQEYLGHVVGGRLPVNHDILYQLQARPRCLLTGGRTQCCRACRRSGGGTQLSCACALIRGVPACGKGAEQQAASRSCAAVGGC